MTIEVVVVALLEVDSITIKAKVAFSVLRVPYHLIITTLKIRETDMVVIINIRVTTIYLKKQTCTTKMICYNYHKLSVEGISVATTIIVILKDIVIIILRTIDNGNKRL